MSHTIESVAETVKRNRKERERGTEDEQKLQKILNMILRADAEGRDKVHVDQDLVTKSIYDELNKHFMVLWYDPHNSDRHIQILW